MKKKLAKPLSVLLAAAMVVGVAQTGFPRVYAVGEEGGGTVTEEASVQPVDGEDWSGPANASDGILIEDTKQKFSFPFEAKNGALIELELDIYLNDDAKELPKSEEDTGKLTGEDYEKAVKFNLPSFGKNRILSQKEIEELVTAWLENIENPDSKANTITFLKAAGVKFNKTKDGEKVASARNVKISYEGDQTKGIWSFTLDTTVLEKIEFLVEAHTNDSKVSWGNNNYMLFDGNTQAYLYTIQEDNSGKVETENDLRDALADNSLDTIALANSIEISEGNIYLTHKVTIDGAGHTLYFTGLEDIESNANDAIIIGPDAKDSVIQDLTVNAGLDDSGTWSGIYAIHAYNTEDVTLENVTATGGNGGILVNSSKVTLKGKIDVSDNAFGGIEVSKGTSPQGDLKLMVNAAIRNDSEKYSQPTIWVDGESALAVANGWVNLPKDTFTAISFIEDEKQQVHYYLDERNSVKSTLAENADELEKALADKAKAIELSEGGSYNFSGKYLNVTYPVMIIGNGAILKFSGLELDEANHDDDAVIIRSTAAGTIIKNLTVDAGLEKPETWDGTYAIHAYNTSGVVLQDVTATAANGGILVNSSEITLKGDINVSDNGFGSIEVSNGADPKGKTSELNAADAYIQNSSENFDEDDDENINNPTIWVDGTNDIAAAAKLVELPEDAFAPLSIENDEHRQVQYYEQLLYDVYALNIRGIDGTGTFHGSYLKDQTVSVNAGTRSGYTFNGWTVSPKEAGEFGKTSAAQTTFTLDEDYDEEEDTVVTVTANWKSNSSSRDDDDSSSGGSSSKPSTGNQDTTGTVTTNPAPGGGTVTTVTTQPSSTVVTGGTAQITATVPDSAAAAIASATPQSPAQVSISVPTAAITQQLQNAEVTRASLTITVPPAVANNTNASAQVVVNADAGLLNAARVAGKDLEITIQNAQTGRTAYAWSFNGSALAQATEIRSLNLALSVQPTSSVPAAQSAAPSSAGIVLHFANNGQLPAPATVTVDVSSQGYQPGQVLYFYYLNPNTGRLEAMNNAQPITVNAQGYAAVTVTHNSDFVLLPKKPGSLTLDTVSYTLPKGKAYEIGAKLAGEGATLKVTPSRSGIVKIENTKSGNYKVTGLTNGITYVSFDVYSGGKLVSHSSVKITVQSSGKAQGLAGRRVMNF